MKRSRFIIKLSVAVACLAIAIGLLPTTSHAQTFFGSIVGTVTDSTGAIVPNATVTITNAATNDKRAAASNATGDFSFVSLVPSTYTVEVQSATFKHFRRDQVVVQVNSTIRVDAALEVGSATETVEVTTQTPLLQTDSSNLGSVVEGKTVDQMPLNGRNTINLLALAPGVVPTNNAMGGASLGSGGHTAASNWSAFSIGGGLTGQNSMYLDGMPLNVLGGASGNGAVGFVPVQDAIQEFSVSSNASSSEFGRYSGGVVNMATKSGGNTLHGTAYEYVRNQLLNANEFFAKGSEIANGKPNKPSQWNQNQFGVTVDGPIKRDKAFFLFTWEAFRAKLASLQGRTVPTSDMLNGIIDEGDISALVNQYSPLGASCGATTDAAKTQTTIPKSCWDQSAAVMLTEWPAAYNGSGTTNFQKLSGTGNNTDNYVGRVDYILSTKQRLFARFAKSSLEDQSQSWMPGGVEPDGKTLWPLGGGTTHNRAIGGVLGDTYSLNPTTIADVRFSVMRVYNDQIPQGAGFDESILKGSWGNLQTQQTVRSIPIININDGTCTTSYCAPTAFANAGQLSEQWNDNTALVFSLTKIVGPHSLKMGGETRFMDRYYINEAGNAAAAAGQFTFSSQYFTTSGFANFLIGLPNNVYLTTVREVAAQNWYQGYYINDTWQATRKLTINAGLRWELPGNIKEKHDNAMVLQPQGNYSYASPITNSTVSLPGTGVLVKSPAYNDRGDEPARYDLFMPNVGMAYRLTDNDVFRAGFGMSVAPIDIQGGIFPENFSMNSFSNTWNYTGQGALGTTYFPLSNPFPAGLTQPITRAKFDGSKFLKQNVSGALPTLKVPETQSWNVAFSHQFKGNMMIEAGYAASKGISLPMTFSFNELPTQYWADQTMPLSNSVQSGNCYAVWGTNTTNAQCARPYSSYLNFNDAIGPYGWTNYQSMPVRLQKRFASGGLVTASYTWSKALGNNNGGSGGNSGVQDWYNLKAEKAITSFSLPRRLVVSYVLNVPFGKGQKFLSTVSNPVATRVISGWTLNGISTFQDGFPVAIAASMPNGFVDVPTNWGAGLRPNYQSGCPKLASGSWKSHVLAGTPVVNTRCWSVPSANYAVLNNQVVPVGTAKATNYATTLGNEPSNDPTVKAPGYNNWDISISKKTAITEGISLEFRAEAFNAFNHVRFGAPGSTVGGGRPPAFGIITSQSQGENQPRLGQLSLRMSF